MNRMIYITTALAFALPAAAQSVMEWPGTFASGHEDSRVELHAPTDPAAVASVTFVNQEVHTTSEEFELTLDGLTVLVLFQWQVDDVGSERITVIPPDGYIARPQELTVPEGESGTLHIYKYLGG